MMRELLEAIWREPGVVFPRHVTGWLTPTDVDAENDRRELEGEHRLRTTNSHSEKFLAVRGKLKK
jgi:hypothetical protein